MTYFQRADQMKVSIVMQNGYARNKKCSQDDKGKSYHT